MELLEREGPLEALTAARNSAGEGHGSVVLVTGEPGIGKTALVTRFVEGLGPDAHVLWGTCDDLSIPRPLGPFRDLAVSASPALEKALASDTPPHQFHSLLLEELEAPPRPTVLVLEDVHWADEATVDAMTVIGRRIAGLPTLLILTYRSGEVDPGHPLHTALGAIRSGTSLYLQLAPLSHHAVATLAGEDADRVYTVTGGNPFYVTEMLAALPAELAPSVANAVLGRTARLSGESRRLVELVSMVPSRVPTAVLDLVRPDWADAAEEPERRQLLEISPLHVRFRHELARAAIRSSVPVARRRRLHAETVRALIELEADSAEIVHHAEEAGDLDVVADHALIAARHAAAVESNREAYAHYQRASQFSDRLSATDQAALFEEFAHSAYTVDQSQDAFAGIGRAIQIYRELGQRSAIGRCTRMLSRLHWNAGNGPAALDEAKASINMLEPLGESVELARAYSSLAGLAMVAMRIREALDWGSRALDLAIKLGDEGTRAHALINVGSARVFVDPDDTALLLEGHALAETVGDSYLAARALVVLSFANTGWVRPKEARRFTDLANEYAREHEVDSYLAYSNSMSAWLHLMSNDWEEAERIAAQEVGQGITVSEFLAKSVVAQLAIRRGKPNAESQMTGVIVQAEQTGELQWLGRALQLETEWALTSGALMPVDRFNRAAEIIAFTPAPLGSLATSTAAWAALAGVSLDYGGQMPPAHAAMARGDWMGAANAFGAVGWDYDRALMLSLLDDIGALTEALEIARRLGAGPLANRVGRRMRELGLTVPQGPREKTLTNPAGLTSRQLEVLQLLNEGLTNAEIAERLFVSPRTAEHHVEAIFAKLGVSNRRDAARRYAEITPAESGDAGSSR